MTYKYLAWDVGIKNLAYNLLEYNPIDKTSKILSWNVINLVELETNPHVTHFICCGKNKNGKACTQKVIELTIDKNKGYCGRHLDKSIVTTKILKKCICTHSVTTKKKGETSITKPCGKPGVMINKVNPYIGTCQMHYKMVTDPENYYMDFKKISESNKFNLTHLATTLYTELNKIRDVLLPAKEVIIENQPVLKNPTMKSVQMLLFSWFFINGIMPNKLEKIALFNAGKKLEAFEGNKNIASNKVDHLKSEYKKTKNSSVIFCRELIKSDKKWLDFLESHSKKDDLADSFMMNLTYIKKNYF
jgi:hypothetical protein